MAWTAIPKNMIAELFCPGVQVSVATDAFGGVPIFPEEEAFITRAIDKRRREFAMGRTCARNALAHFGVPPGPILVGKDRAPIWPDGYIGSITHCDGFCAAVAAPKSMLLSVGLDAEPATPMRPELMSYICTKDEEIRFGERPDLSSGDWGKLTFCAKEAFYKCYFQIARSMLGFHDVILNFDTVKIGRDGMRQTTFSANIINADAPLREMAEKVIGRVHMSDAFVLTGASLKN